jgi:hypothetical protein
MASRKGTAESSEQARDDGASNQYQGQGNESFDDNTNHSSYGKTGGRLNLFRPFSSF